MRGGRAKGRAPGHHTRSATRASCRRDPAGLLFLPSSLQLPRSSLKPSARTWPCSTQWPHGFPCHPEEKSRYSRFPQGPSWSGLCGLSVLLSSCSALHPLQASRLATPLSYTCRAPTLPNGLGPGHCHSLGHASSNQVWPRSFTNLNSWLKQHLLHEASSDHLV